MYAALKPVSRTWRKKDAYHLVISVLSYHLINSSDFYLPTSLPNKRTEVNATIRRLVEHPTCPLSDRPTRKGVSYRRQEKVCLSAGTLTGFWEQKSHSSLGHFLYAVQAPLKMPQWANGVTPLWTPPFAMRHDRSGRKQTNQIVKPENEKQAWDI